MPIFEDRYQPWVGKAQPRLVRMAVLAREEFKLIFSGLWMKIAIGLILLVAAGISFVFFVIASINMRQVEHVMSQYLGNAVYRTSLSFDAVLIVALAAVAASGIIAKDLRSNATLLYFARPIGKLDYLMGKFLAAAGCMALGTLVPTVFLWIAAIVFKMEDCSWSSRFMDLGSIVLHSMLIIVPSTSIVLALSACTRWTAAAGILWVMLYLASATVGEFSQQLTHNQMGALFSLAEIWHDLGDFIYERRGKASFAIHPFGLEEMVGILAGLTAAAWTVLLLRARRIEKA